MVYCLKNLLHFEARIFSSNNYIFFSSSQPITPATSTNTNPWNENIYLYLKKAYLPAWKLNVDFNYLKNTGNCMLLIFISKKLHKDLELKHGGQPFGFYRKMNFLFRGELIFLCNLNFDPLTCIFVGHVYWCQWIGTVQYRS